jgi:hypothetical protein
MKEVNDVNLGVEELAAEAEALSSRRGFLRKLGLMTAVGLGVALVPAREARAESSFCCKDTSCGSCPPGSYQYFCHDNCTGTTCCSGCVSTWGDPCQYQLPCTCS